MNKTSKSQTKQDNSRSNHRAYAFQVLYSLNFSQSIDCLKETYNGFLEESKLSGQDMNTFAWSIIHGVWENLDDLDDIISQYSRNWKLKRIAKIELTILRLSVYEMRYCQDMPLKVAINEGVELAKKFGDGNSRNFVNGILDAVGKDIKNGKFGISKGF